MYSPRYVVARPGVFPSACRQGVRNLERCAPSRGFAHHWPAVHPYARSGFPGLTNDFAPFFRMIDDLSRAPLDSFFQNARQQNFQVYQPRFDVKENEGGYELRGELPGVDAENISIEFTDPQTLVIRGRTERERPEGHSPVDATSAAQILTQSEQQQTTQDDASDSASMVSDSSYQRPSVADVDAQGNEVNTPSSEVSATNAEAESSKQAAEHQQQQEHPEPAKERYWVSERSVGEFARTFAFPGRIDQENVTANLTNGILNIVVPRAAAPEARRINIRTV